jgi:hypothetical protein
LQNRICLLDKQETKMMRTIERVQKRAEQLRVIQREQEARQETKANA